MYIVNGNENGVHDMIHCVADENNCEISVENVELELINVYNISCLCFLGKIYNSETKDERMYALSITIRTDII